MNLRFAASAIRVDQERVRTENSGRATDNKTMTVCNKGVGAKNWAFCDDSDDPGAGKSLWHELIKGGDHLGAQITHLQAKCASSSYYQPLATRLGSVLLVVDVLSDQAIVARQRDIARAADLKFRR